MGKIIGYSLFLVVNFRNYNKQKEQFFCLQLNKNKQMKKLFLIVITVIGFISYSIAQDAQSDIKITGNYRINTIMPLGKFRLWVTLSNVSNSDYKDIVYRVTYIAGDGTIEGSNDYVLHDYIGPGITKKLKEAYLDCPKDCKSISLSMVNSNKLR